MCLRFPVSVPKTLFMPGSIWECSKLCVTLTNLSSTSEGKKHRQVFSPLTFYKIWVCGISFRRAGNFPRKAHYLGMFILLLLGFQKIYMPSLGEAPDKDYYEGSVKFLSVQIKIMYNTSAVPGASVPSWFTYLVNISGTSSSTVTCSPLNLEW